MQLAGALGNIERLFVMGGTFIQKSAGKGSLRGHLARQDALGKSGIVVPAAATETVIDPPPITCHRA